MTGARVTGFRRRGEIHPDAPGRRRFRAAASRHVRADRADAGCGPTSRHRTSIWCWRPMMAGGWASSIRAASARSIWCRPAQEDAHRLLAELGPEPLDAAFTPARLSAALIGKRTPIKAALLDQKVVAGLGNIYVCEALFRARLSPLRLGAHHPGHARGAAGAGDQGDVAGGDRRRRIIAARLCAAGRRTGLFPARLEGVWPRGRSRASAVPGRPACPGIRRITQSARSTFYCPRSQR